MLTDGELRGLAAGRNRTALLVLGGAVGICGLYLFGLDRFHESLQAWVGDRFGGAAREAVPSLLVLPTYAVLIGACFLADRRLRRFRVECPLCRADVSTATDRLLRTRCCPRCGGRIVAGGRVHSPAVYRRSQTIRMYRSLRLWCWAWPAMGVLALACGWLAPSAYQDASQVLWIGPLVGLVMAGWIGVRTRDRRYVPHALVSLLLLGVGIAWAW